MTEHPGHQENLPRINRIIGQMEGIRRMVVESRYCPDILIQLRAVRSAIKQVENNILRKHLQHCVAQAFASGEGAEEKIEELGKIFTRFDD